MDSRTDEQLVEAYRTGERQAMAVLIARYQTDLLGFLTRLLGDRAAAEDVFQETFLQIHQSAAGFDITRRFKPWLFTIAANKGRDWYRKNGRSHAMVGLSAPLGTGNHHVSAFSEGGTLVDLLSADFEPVDASLTHAETRQMVRETVESMPHHLKEVLLLAYFQRLSYNDIADTLEIPLGTVKSRLHAAVAYFADRWKHQVKYDVNAGQEDF